MKKRFIEWNLPLAEISEASAREKYIRFGHPSTLHIWWARRPLASSRATSFAALIDLPDDFEKRKEVIELIKKITPWEAVKNGNDQNIRKAQHMIEKQWGDNPPKVLDPFAGGGSIPLEALRLGCETYASDYNPVAVFIEKATIEWPQKYGVMIPRPGEKPGIDGKVEKVNLLAYLVEKWTNELLRRARDEIGRFYLDEPDGSVPVGYLWARTIQCQNPECEAEVPLIRQFWLSKKKRKVVAYRPVVDHKNKTVEFEIVRGDSNGFDPSKGTVSRSNARCPVCGQVTTASVIRSLGTKGRIGERMVVVVLKNPQRTGKHYRIAMERDKQLFERAKEHLVEKAEKWRWLDNPLPEEELPYLRSIFNVNVYGMTNWQDLFNPRQKLAMVIFVEKMKLAYDEIRRDCRNLGTEIHGLDAKEIAKAVMGYLGVVVDMHSAFNNRLARWENTSEIIKHLFGRQALGMMWDYVEVSPFSGSSGTPSSGLRYYLENIEFAAPSRLNGSFNLGLHSATSLPYPDEYFDAIFTDPPYYDNVPYADLSDFFYVWLKRSLGDILPEILSTPMTPKDLEVVQLAERNPKYSFKTRQFFEGGLTESFREIRRTLVPGGIATIVFAHKTTVAWETMLDSLVNAGLVVTASWPIHTEMKVRLRAAASAALASSIYMVCRKSEREKVGFYSEIQPRIKERVETKLQQFWNEGIVGGDFFISAIGPGMEIFSQYERVEKLSGEQVTTAELLDYIRSVSTDFVVRKLLEDVTSAKIDNESDFYLAYRWTYLDNTVEYDDARKLASASGASLEDLWGPGGFVKKGGSKISVLGPKDREKVGSIQNMVDVMHKCLLLWEKGKKEEIADLLARTGFREDPAFRQFCQAVAECLLEGNKEKQLLEGFLMSIGDYARLKVKARKNQKDLRQFGGG